MAESEWRADLVAMLEMISDEVGFANEALEAMTADQALPAMKSIVSRLHRS